MSVECKHCKYFKLNGFNVVKVGNCLHPKNLWNSTKRSVVSYRLLNSYEDYDWYKPSIKKRLENQKVRAKQKLDYIILSARRRFRP